MRVNPELSEKIVTTLKTFVDNPEPFSINVDKPIDLKKLAAEFNVLPLSLHSSSCYAIRPNGEIVVMDFNEDNIYTLLDEEIEPRIRGIMLCQGAKKFPQLAELMPVRPIDAIDCKYCDGTGIEPLNKKLGFDEERVVCYCGGLGWIPKDENWNSLNV